jgi:predicted metal-dependent hydrolase
LVDFKQCVEVTHKPFPIDGIVIGEYDALAEYMPLWNGNDPTLAIAFPTQERYFSDTERIVCRLHQKLVQQCALVKQVDGFVYRLALHRKPKTIRHDKIAREGLFCSAVKFDLLRSCAARHADSCERQTEPLGQDFCQFQFRSVSLAF